MQSRLSHMLLATLIAAWSSAGLAAAKVDAVTPDAALSKAKGTGAMYADAGGKKKRAGGGGAKAGKGGGREKHITREATMKGKDATKVDFDSVDIGGQRKTPMGTLINQNKADKNYDFVKIRLRWHPEMVQSASALDSGDTE